MYIILPFFSHFFCFKYLRKTTNLQQMVNKKYTFYFIINKYIIFNLFLQHGMIVDIQQQQKNNNNIFFEPFLKSFSLTNTLTDTHAVYFKH